MIDWIMDKLVRRYGRNIVRACLVAIATYSLKDANMDPATGEVFVESGSQILTTVIGLGVVEIWSWTQKYLEGKK